MFRVVKELVGRVFLNDFAFVHENHAVGHGFGETHFVGHAQHGHALLREFHHHIQHFLDHFRIQRRGRLVKQHDARVHAQTARDGDALLLAAGELPGEFVRLLGNLHALQVFHRGRDRLGLRRFAHPYRRERAVFQHGQVREQIEVLKNHADFLADGFNVFQVVGQFHPVHDDVALLVLLQAVDAADHRGFARAGGPANHDALAAAHLQVDVLQDMELAVPLVHGLNFDRQFGMGFFGFRHGRTSG